MPTEVITPDQPAGQPPENNEQTGWIERVWKNRWGKSAVIAAGVMLALLLVAAGVAGWFYARDSRLIDAQLEGGPFRDSINIYGAPQILNDGDTLSAADVEAELRLCGYQPLGEGDKTGNFRTIPGGLEVIPSAASGEPSVRILFSGSAVQHINAGTRDLKTWSMGYPLLENLSSGKERRNMITYKELPPVLINAVVSVEDKHFFHHRGLDVKRVAKALYVDLKEHRKEQGASTLTMQLVRGLWLAPEKRWKRKITEALMTVHLERRWTKEEIFTAYANMVFIGREADYSIHGFAAGAQLYFGKHLNDLTLPEAALLAGMVQRPSYFNPYRNPERAVKRRNVVLLLMRENKYITPDQYESAVTAPLKVVGQSGGHEPLGAPYFLDQVSEELQSIDQGEEGSKSIYTTIDLNLQRAAGEAIESGMKDVDKLLAKQYGKGGPHAEAALIALDPHTGEVKAMVGGRDYTRSQLNRIFSRRPPGSVFKPFVYAAAMKTGIDGAETVLTPATTVDDTPTTFTYDRVQYRPSNFRNEVFGTLTLRQALAKSDNVAAVKVAEMVGFPAVVAMARSAGLNGDIKPTPAVALGSYDVTPFEIAGAYTAFANGGMRVQPRMVLRVEDSDGGKIHTEQSETRQAMDPRVAYLITSMLEEVMRSGTAAGVRGRGFVVPAAGKTGTSHDGWFAGYTSQLLCIVWVGFDDYRELNLEGAKSALPIWTEFMKKAGSLGGYKNVREFPKPDGVVSAKICPESGMLAGAFCPKSVNDVFIAGTEPKDQCDIHTGQPATPDPSGAAPATWGIGNPVQTLWLPGAPPAQPPHSPIVPADTAPQP